MSLQRGKYSDVPKDAIILSENEALKYQMEVLKNWKHKRDTLAFKYGTWALSAASFGTGLFINSFFRHKLKLLHYGRASTYLPSCVLPATFSTLFHIQFVLKDVILQKPNTCPVCLEMRAAAFQSLLGCAFPALLAPAATLSVAHKYYTYNLPYITDDTRKFFKTLQTLYKPIAKTVFWIFIGQAMLASIVTYLEAQSVFNVNHKLSLFEESMKNPKNE